MLMVEEMASKVKQYSHTRRWIVGTLTNSLRVNQIPVRPPDALIFLNTMTSILKPHYAIIEAGKMAIPTVGIVDSNSSMFCSAVAYAIIHTSKVVLVITPYLRSYGHNINSLLGLE